MVCPRCKETLVKENVENEDIDVCKSCSGMWVHKHQLDNMISESGGDVELCSIDDKKHEDKEPKIKCRECKDVEMKKINFLDYSDIIIDYCPSCGSFWVDKDELANMHEYMKQVKDGSKDVNDKSTYNLLVQLSKISYSIFH